MKIGEIIGEHFRIARWVARGGTSEVFLARDLTTDRDVALKVLTLQSLEGTTRFRREIGALARLRDELIVEYRSHGALPDGNAYLVTEWLEGHVLSQILAARRPTVREALGLVTHAARALGRAHAGGFVHRDVTPRNLMVLRDGRPPLKLLDFGLVTAFDRAAPLTRTGHPLGTPGYLAPEQLLGERDVDARSDVFGLGCVLYECLTGMRPFRADTLSGALRQTLFEDPPRPHDVVPGLAAELSEVVLGMIAKNRDDRPPDGTSVARKLDDLRRRLAH